MVVMVPSRAADWSLAPLRNSELIVADVNTPFDGPRCTGPVQRRRIQPAILGKELVPSPEAQLATDRRGPVLERETVIVAIAANGGAPVHAVIAESGADARHEHGVVVA